LITGREEMIVLMSFFVINPSPSKSYISKISSVFSSKFEQKTLKRPVRNSL
jgi:hypothetical protein